MSGLAMKRWMIGAAALLCSGCIVQDEPDDENDAVDMALDQGIDPDSGPPRPDARVLRDAEPPIPDMQRRDRGVPIDQGPVPDMRPAPDMGPGGVVFDTLLLFDDGSMDDNIGTSGVDFCGASADCASAVSATLVLGGGTICRSEGPGCVTDRTDAVAILDDGSSCETASVPSDFVSVGTDGMIAVGFDGDLRGCTVTVVEFAGANIEAWEAYVCDTGDVAIANCLNQDQPVQSAANGGTVTFNLPGE